MRGWCDCVDMKEEEEETTFRPVLTSSTLKERRQRSYSQEEEEEERQEGRAENSASVSRDSGLVSRDLSLTSRDSRASTQYSNVLYILYSSKFTYVAIYFQTAFKHYISLFCHEFFKLLTFVCT